VLQQPRRTFRDGAPGVELVATPTVASRDRTPVRKEDGVLMTNIAKRLKSYRAERAERRFKKRHSDYGVYFPLREEHRLLQRETNERVVQYLSLDDIKTVYHYTCHPIPLGRGHTAVMCNENLPGWWGGDVRRALNAAGVISMEGPKPCYEEGVVGVVVMPDGVILKDFGDLSHEAKLAHKEFRYAGRPKFDPYESVRSTESCVLIHVPHGSEVLPELSAWGVREDASVTDLLVEEQAREARLLCDTGCLELVRELREGDLSSVSVFAARFSRIWLDAERFRDPKLEEMSAAGMGVIYERTSDGKPLRDSWTDAVREEVLRHYDTYHDRLKREIREIAEKLGVCVIIDLHSYSKEPLPYELRQDASRPELCIGTDEAATPPWLLELVLSSFSGVCEVELNTPFSGTFTPSGVGLSETPVVSVMLEFRKDVLNDPTRTASIKDAILRLTCALNERCGPQAPSSSDETVEVQKERDMEDSNMLKKIAETTDSEFTPHIENGVLYTTQLAPGVAMSVALAGAESNTAEAQDETDSLAKQLEKLRAENARYRDHLEYLQTVLENLGCYEVSAQIDLTLWPVIGVLEDGTEVVFAYDDDEAEIECDYCSQGLTCDCEEAQ
jgi:N-formylglutamate deformylase